MCGVWAGLSDVWGMGRTECDVWVLAGLSVMCGVWGGRSVMTVSAALSLMSGQDGV
jgi:hypothetical protein